MSKMKKTRFNANVNSELHKRYKKFCKENGLVMGKRIEELMRADLEKRLIKIPEVKL